MAELEIAAYIRLLAPFWATALRQDHPRVPDSSAGCQSELPVVAYGSVALILIGFGVATRAALFFQQQGDTWPCPTVAASAGAGRRSFIQWPCNEQLPHELIDDHNSDADCQAQEIDRANLEGAPPFEMVLPCGKPSKQDRQRNGDG